MILVDSSVWIDLLNNAVTDPVRRLRELIPTTPRLIGDLIPLEVLHVSEMKRRQNSSNARCGGSRRSRCSIRISRLKLL